MTTIKTNIAFRIKAENSVILTNKSIGNHYQENNSSSNQKFQSMKGYGENNSNSKKANMDIAKRTNAGKSAHTYTLAVKTTTSTRLSEAEKIIALATTAQSIKAHQDFI